MPESVTAQKVSKSFGHYSRLALAAPVKITHHGQDNLVLLSHREYERLKRRDREALRLEQFSDADRAAVSASRAAPISRQFDDEVEPRQ